MNFNVTKSVYFAYFVYYLDRCHGDDNFFIHVHDMSPLIKYVIHQTVLSLRHLSQTPNEKPTHDDESSHTCLHWLTPLGEREGGREGDPPESIPYVRLPDPLGQVDSHFTIYLYMYTTIPLRSHVLTVHTVT